MLACDAPHMLSLIAPFQVCSAALTVREPDGEHVRASVAMAVAARRAIIPCPPMLSYGRF
jgi:hypothetical protein